jgi:hypothetical protein
MLCGDGSDYPYEVLAKRPIGGRSYDDLRLHTVGDLLTRDPPYASPLVAVDFPESFPRENLEEIANGLLSSVLVTISGKSPTLYCKDPSAWQLRLLPKRGAICIAVGLPDISQGTGFVPGIPQRQTGEPGCGKA